ncbi:hypothetical protein L3Q82_003301 [Scortum barcoo]|uniref:Uncharacterized protein n=1 Tax=Scortum barcoo TaxID=214431 RepID=A0ACB8VMG0_9TELE|nr:hypothetical protein L3Q82_003301 [Scortum barcoo]
MLWWRACLLPGLGQQKSFTVTRGETLSQVCSLLCVIVWACKRPRLHPLHPQSDGLVERFNRTLAKQLAILTTEHQRDWDMHLPLVLMAYRSAVQDSTSCTPALLMLGRELRTPAEMAFGIDPQTHRGFHLDQSTPGDSRTAWSRLMPLPATSCRKQGVRQKRNYDIRARGTDFKAGDLVWVYSPRRRKGRCPKLDCHWVGPCEVLEKKLGERDPSSVALPQDPTDAAKLLNDNLSVQVRSAPVREEVVRQNTLTVVRQRGGDASDRTELCGEEDVLQFGKYRVSHHILLHNFLPMTEISVRIGMTTELESAGLWSASILVHNPAKTKVTNHVTRSGGGKVQPGLGVSWSHIPRTRILLERVEKAATVGRSSRRSATLIKSSRQVRQAASSDRFCQRGSAERRMSQRPVETGDFEVVPVTSKRSLTGSGGVALQKDPQERENWMRLIPDKSEKHNPPPKRLIKGVRSKKPFSISSDCTKESHDLESK